MIKKTSWMSFTPKLIVIIDAQNANNLEEFLLESVYKTKATKKSSRKQKFKIGIISNMFGKFSSSKSELKCLL
jgi:hypothetical protein